ncbi:ABC transporter permease [Pectobacterium polonicum]|uniref:ABC transporter permease n=1 Tax=Pectobacterium polonicum TaxID=2485124 RepID=A0AAE9NPY2_9GAMM|nr:ABC transporter permease [Pectobacterium polonicum]MDC9820031.1 ABC transporter permease [Pectobacterium polonicum]UVO07721.1 ABC transporter permease [Pectobacterium polonicum]
MKRYIFKPSGADVGLLFLIALCCALFSVMLPGRFFTTSTFMSMAFQLPELGLLTLGMFIAILSGGLNLCIIATANLTSLFIAWVLLHFLPEGAGTAMQLLWLGIGLLGASVIAVVIGALTGFMVTKVGAHPILVTLASMMTVNGIGIWLTKGAAVSGMPDVLRTLGSGTWLGIPLPLWLFMAAAGALALFLGKTRAGKCIYMGGSNINATWFSGINTHRMLMLVYVISSLMCVLAGLVMMARFNSARMGYGDSYLLLTVLAIILGGTDPNGGFGRVTGVVLSLIVLQILSTGFNLMNISQHFSLAMWGAVLIVVLALKFFKARYSDYRAVRLSALRARAAHLTEKKEI